MIQERNALMEHVYYKLKKYCLEKYRLEFQASDLKLNSEDERLLSLLISNTLILLYFGNDFELIR